MKIQDQCCTLEQAKKLKELGVAQESFLCWINHSGHKPEITHKSKYRSIGYVDIEQGGIFSCELGHECVAAFTVSELGVMLLGSKAESTVWTEETEWLTSLNGSVIGSFANEAEARAAMLIHLLENNLITAEEVNARLNSHP